MCFLCLVLWCICWFVWSWFVWGRFVLRVLGFTLVGDNGFETIAVVDVGDGLSATVGKVDGVGALGLVAITVLRGLKVSTRVVILYTIAVLILGWGLWVCRFWVVGLVGLRLVVGWCRVVVGGLGGKGHNAHAGEEDNLECH